MKRMLAIAVGTCTLTASTFAQIPGRKPGPEHARLGYFEGTWKSEGVSEDRRYRADQTCEWFTGGFHLVCRSQASGDLGAVSNQVVFGYDRGTKAYTLHTINSLGITLSARGTVAGNVWTWETELVGESGPFKARLTITEQSPRAYTTRLEGLLGGTWVTLEEERAAKVQ